MRLLVVDDDADARRIIRAGLEQLGGRRGNGSDRGMQVSEAVCGAEGLTMARRDHPDAILLDANLQGMDGPAVLTALRADSTTALIPVVFLAVPTAPRDVQRLHDLGVTGVIPKPVDPKTLAAQLHTLLDHGAADTLAGFMPLLNTLRQDYQRTLPGKIEHLSALAKRAELLPDDAEARAKLELAVHQLHGTAGSYGFARVSRIAGEWEAALKEDAGPAPDPGRRAAPYLAALAWALLKTAADELPLSRVPVHPAPPPDAPCVLVVDDDAELAACFAALLRADGLRVETAHNGREALDRLTPVKPALILSDVSMPGIDGYELCRAVRSLGYQDVPFIFCTALGQPPLRLEGLRCGAVDYLVKPVEPQELRLKVRNHLEHLHRLREIAAAPELIRGSLAEIDPAMLLQMLVARGAEPVCMMFERNGERGEIQLRGGNPVHAVLGEFTGQKAFFRMLDWRSGEFWLERVSRETGTSLSGSLEGLLLEGMRQQDECRKLLLELGRVKIPPGAEEKAAGEAPEALRRVFKGIQQERPLAELMNLSTLPDLEILRRLNALVAAGALQSVAQR